MKKLIWLLILGMFLGGCATTYSLEKTYFDKGRYDDAIMDMRYKVRSKPNNPDFLFNLGVAYNKCQLYEDALIPLEKAKALQPEAFDIRFSLGLAYFGLDRYREAEEVLKAAIERDPNNPEGYIGLMQVYSRIGDKIRYNETLSTLRNVDAKRAAILGKRNEAIKKPQEKYDPELSRKYNEEAADLIKAKKYHEAILAGDKARDYDSNNADAYFNMGLATSRTEQYHKALALYKKTISLDPTYVAAYVNMGMIYSSIDRKEDAVSVLKKAIASDPNVPEAYANLGSVYKDMGRVKEARENLNKALELFEMLGRKEGIDKVKKLIKKLR